LDRNGWPSRLNPLAWLMSMPTLCDLSILFIHVINIFMGDSPNDAYRVIQKRDMLSVVSVDFIDAMDAVFCDVLGGCYVLL
jgi:hypothetical protein